MEGPFSIYTINITIIILYNSDVIYKDKINLFR